MLSLVKKPTPGKIELKVRFAVPEAKGINADKSHRRLVDVLILEYQNGPPLKW